VGTASAATYTGHVKGASGSSVEFKKRKVDGKLRVTDIGFATVPFQCENGPTVVTGPIYADGGVHHGAFDARYEDSSFRQRFAGEFRPKDRASGVMKVKYDAGGASGICVSGKLDWVAKKG
jgi:hypothetical protein